MTNAGQEIVVCAPPNGLKEKAALGGLVTGHGFDAKLLVEVGINFAALRGKLLEAAARDMAGLEEVRGSLENEPSRRDELFTALEKIAHEVAGYGTTIGFNLLTRFGCALCFFLRKTDIEDMVKIKIACALVDAMCLVYRTPIKGQGGEDGDTLTSSLNLIVSKTISEK